MGFTDILRSMFFPLRDGHKFTLQFLPQETGGNTFRAGSCPAQKMHIV
jgi:hypothetical protein